MTTEKFICKRCINPCFISITFNPGDLKTQALLICPLQMQKYEFEVLEKHPDNTQIKTRPPFDVIKHLDFLKRERIINRQIHLLRKCAKDCTKCKHDKDEDYCFAHCRGFDGFEPILELYDAKKERPKIGGIDSTGVTLKGTFHGNA